MTRQRAAAACVTGLWVYGAAVGCASKRHAAAAPAPIAGREEHAASPLHLDGVVVRAETDPLTGLESYDALTLIHLAVEAEGHESWGLAAALYERLLNELPESSLVPGARFGLGRAYERLGQLALAIVSYRALVAMPLPEGGDERATWLDGHYRLGACLDEQGAAWDAVAVFDRLLSLTWLSSFDRIEALVGRGRALQRALAPDAAETAYAQAVRLYESARVDEQVAEQTLAGEAALAWGTIAATRYDAVVLAYPIEVLRERLEQKCALLLSAQQRLLRAVRYGDGATVVAAGFRIGSLYEALFDGITSLAAPPELTSEQTSVYQDEVRSRVGVLVQKAIMVYERTLLAGRTAPGAEPWVQRIEHALVRLKAVYLKQGGGAEVGT